ncbi:hypothetical protein AVEN_119370-1 [Araneus ventricosus]|uniref:Uncharacterized protein n=1 Tax=Araneus ventricosus TaxID=182803 RepID=A0A4Y2KWZ5_ARAVE|nr:hypothetical protein AVEN_119370-1 [Araneus ventricosus]
MVEHSLDGQKYYICVEMTKTMKGTRLSVAYPPLILLSPATRDSLVVNFLRADPYTKLEHSGTASFSDYTTGTELRNLTQHALYFAHKRDG